MLYVAVVLLCLPSCMSVKENIATETIVNLTSSKKGHMLHHNGVFSKDGQWIVYDGRNDDTKIGETAGIGVVNIHNGEEQEIYQTANQTKFGPGVGAVSFSPAQDRVVFIHGLPNADEERPYALTRRTGVAIDLDRPFVPVLLDARDMTVPYVPGSLRGGTHSHMWNGNGQIISFTYNDELVEPDLRVVGVMSPYEDGVQVDLVPGNNNGEMYSAIISDVVANPKAGSDQINKAFDECWVGENGYKNADGNHVPYAIAFQGNTIDVAGNVVTEIFVVDIDAKKILSDPEAVGRQGERPRVPGGIVQRRLTHSRGLSDLRHWLRSSHDGEYIYALAKDDLGNNQVVRCRVHGGELSFVTDHSFSISSPFNLSRDSKQITFVADNNVFVHDIASHKSVQLTHNTSKDPKVVGTPSFSPDGRYLVFNQFEKIGEQEYIQIKRMDVRDED